MDIRDYSNDYRDYLTVGKERYDSIKIGDEISFE